MSRLLGLFVVKNSPCTRGPVTGLLNPNPMDNPPKETEGQVLHPIKNVRALFQTATLAFWQD